MKHVGDAGFQRGAGGFRLFPEQVPHPVQQRVHPKGFWQKIGSAQLRCFRQRLVGNKCGGQNGHGSIAKLLKFSQSAETVQPRQDHIHDQNIRFLLLNFIQNFVPGLCNFYQKFSCSFHGFPQQNAEFRAGICQQHRSALFHVPTTPSQ